MLVEKSCLYLSINNQIATVTTDALLLVVSPGTLCNDVDFDDHIAQAIALYEADAYEAVLTWSPFYAPNARQRRKTERLTQAIDFSKIKGQALVTNSILVRGALRAMHWLIESKFRLVPFSVQETNAAIACLATLAPFDQKKAAEMLRQAIGDTGGDVGLFAA
jgi:hypothetical protein